MPKKDEAKPASEEVKREPPKPRGDQPRELARGELEELRRQLEKKFH